MNPVSFELPEIKQRCLELHHATGSRAASQDPRDARGMFIAAISILSAAMLLRASEEEVAEVRDLELIRYLDH